MNIKKLVQLAGYFEKKMNKTSNFSDFSKYLELPPEEEQDEKSQIVSKLKDVGNQQSKLKDKIFDATYTTKHRDNDTISDLRKEFEKLEEQVIDLRMELEALENQSKADESELGEDLDPYTLIPDY